MGLKGKIAPAITSFFVFYCGILSFLGAQTSQTILPAAQQYNTMDDSSLSPRAAAMGGAFVAVADDPSALFSNPAGLGSLNRGELALFSDFGWVDTFQETAVMGFPIDRFGGVGLAGSYLSFGSIEGHDETGALTPSYDADRVSYHVGWGMDFSDRLSLGAAFHGTQQSIAGKGYTFFSPEIGLLFKTLKGLQFGLDYTNGGWGSWPGPFVSTFKAGTSFNLDLDPGTGILAALSSSFQTNSLSYLQAGMEVAFQSRFFLRTGYQADLGNDNGNDGFSLGGGLSLAGFILDYAYLPDSTLGDSHRFSLTYFFNTWQRNSPVSPSVDKKAPENSPEAIAGNAGKAISASSATASTPPPIDKTSGNASQTAGGGTPAKDSLTVRFNIPPDFVSQGEALENQGLFADALMRFQEGVQEDPRNTLAWWDMGMVYYKLSKKTYAIQCFEMVLQLQPANQALTNWLANYRAQP
jgi:hypothetical protein